MRSVFGTNPVGHRFVPSAASNGPLRGHEGEAGADPAAG
ncbi:hypothetical protein [Azospirillum doebereinerae]